MSGPNPPKPQSDPAARRSDRAFVAFGWYLRWYFWRHFPAVRVSLAGGPGVPAGRVVGDGGAVVAGLDHVADGGV